MVHDYNSNQNIYDNISKEAGDAWEGNIDFDELRKTNPDIVGWLYYEGTKIDYPIVQGQDNEKYLHTMFDGTYSGFGTLFVDAITEDAFNQFNTIVYGHHMLNGSMFGDLKKLKEPDYCKEHPQFELITPEGKYHLRIWAFLNEPADSAVYTTNFHDRDQMQSYLDLIWSMALYGTSVEVTPDDKLVVLSTCAYEYQDARYMVICKMEPW
ncbi:MAG: class B sortase [Clostridiales bacterium]|nr:class B sortase [Clostridiales bacterium]